MKTYPHPIIYCSAANGLELSFYWEKSVLRFQQRHTVAVWTQFLGQQLADYKKGMPREVRQHYVLQSLIENTFCNIRVVFELKPESCYFFSDHAQGLSIGRCLSTIVLRLLIISSSIQYSWTVGSGFGTSNLPWFHYITIIFHISNTLLVQLISMIKTAPAWK